MHIEAAAVSEVMSHIANTDYLAPSINSSDKEPSWDGHIYVYSHMSHEKSMLTGRVPTQVKGKKVSALVDGTIPYPIDVIDLKNYLLDGGVFYFVVLLSPTGKKIYYSILLPYDINEILLKLAESQKSVSVHFDEFPNDKTEITDLFLNFLRDRDFQRSLSVIRKDEFNLLMKNGQFKEYKLGFTT